MKISKHKGFALFVVATSWLSAADSIVFEKARVLYEKTDYPASAKLLEAGKDLSGRELNLLGRNYYMMLDYKKATGLFESAAKLEPRVAVHWQWIGRSYGRRAELSSFVTAPGYASKARQNFERAVELDPRNLEALSDLFEYYLQAPGFLGGGLDKAEGLIEKFGAVDAIEKHWAMARLAEQKKDFHSAEAQLRRSIELAPKQIGRLVDLAVFLARRGRTQESDAVFERSRKMEPNHPTYLWQRANILIEQKRSLPEAKQLLEKYMAANVQPEDDHKAEARKLLEKLQGV